MHIYMADLVDLPPDDIEALRQHYLDKYGTTLRGLQIHYQIDTDQYLAYVHDLPLAEFIKPDPDLNKLLSTLPQKKYIFTNADIQHARRVLDVLKMGEWYEQIIDIRALSFVCKPDPDAYQRALEIAGISKPEECILFDDAPRNLKPAREQGWLTVLVGNGRADPSADHCITSLHDIPVAMPQLWNHLP